MRPSIGTCACGCSATIRRAADDERLAAAEVGALLAALDQGVTLLGLSGLAAIDQRMMRIGLRRLVDPARAVADDSADAPGGPAALHDEVIRRRIAAARWEE
ncbi:hypothetical protein AB0L25_37035 [Spirillospora sp. NPDC052242]